jgi:DNA-directed RNA polymerase specialized sigma24 family protein
MARTFAEAVAAIDGPKLDAILGYTLPPRTHAPTPEEVSAAFAGFDYTAVRRIARRLSRRFYCDLADGEDAAHDSLYRLLVERPDLYRESPDRWMGYLWVLSRYRLLEIRSRRDIASIEDLSERGRGHELAGARLCVPPSLDAEQTLRREPPPQPGGAWSRAQVLGAMQRFRDYHGRPPRARECRPIHGLPNPSVIYRHFPDFGSAVLAAGMVPDGLGRRHGPWTAIEAARSCAWFRRHHGYWPNRSDISRRPGELPSAQAMLRFFGGTRAEEIQAGVEAILAARPSRLARGHDRSSGTSVS